MKDKLKSDMLVAIAWGVADSESIGFTQRELCSLLRRALTRIEYLEKFEPPKEKVEKDDI